MADIALTKEQLAIIRHEGSAFISACPGAGKTRCIVDRARAMLSKTGTCRGLSFLSFTNAAVSELQERLARDRLLSSTVFPHFVGTFDSFIWHYMVEPFALLELLNQEKQINTLCLTGWKLKSKEEFL